jgi:transposase-like protein
MENELDELEKLIRQLTTRHGVSRAKEAVNKILEQEREDNKVPECPHCHSQDVRKDGHKDGKQRYLCGGCGRVFTKATGSIMQGSHYRKEIWEQAIRDTGVGKSLEKSAQELKITHNAMFNLRHKILLGMQDREKENPTVLNGVCEIDDAFVLESLKGTPVPGNYWRKARKHGAKAQKVGISDEYIDISTGVERNGKSYCKSVNRASPGKEDIERVFTGHIGENALVLCDGEKSYHAITDIANCVVRNVKDKETTEGGKGFFNINTVNSLHSFIKNQYRAYRGVATKYLNRYNVLFARAYTNTTMSDADIADLLKQSDGIHCHTIKDVRTYDLLNI